MFVLCIVVAPKGEFQYTFRPCSVVGKEERGEERKREEKGKEKKKDGEFNFFFFGLR